MDNQAYTEDEKPRNGSTNGTLCPSDISSIDTEVPKNGQTNGWTQNGNGVQNGDVEQNGTLPPKSDSEPSVEEVQQKLRDRDPIFFCRWITTYPKSFFGKIHYVKCFLRSIYHCLSHSSL